jgi:broad specificity polyphosphatase/5'/3'-nucleotidase SurE
MPSLQQIADHLGINKNATAKQIRKLCIPYKTMTLDAIARAYMERQRAIASGHLATFSNGDVDLDLMQERAKKERCERELLEIKLAKRQTEVINVPELDGKYQWLVALTKKHMHLSDKAIVKQTKQHYGIEIDIALIHEYTNTALNHLTPIKE